ncbi:GntR family transcriptional regulator, transcriptional repressor for pyruvate dehydrogenase complex [Paraburkholderia kururiensis]
MIAPGFALQSTPIFDKLAAVRRCCFDPRPPVTTTGDDHKQATMASERKATGLPEQIYTDILNRILEGEYKEGDRLPTEHALAERFETSRPTVREALARLRADGIVVTRHGSGTTVARRPDPDVRRFAPLETLSDIRRCYEFRVVTEAGAAALAAQQAEPEDIEAIQQAWDDLERVVETQGIGAKDDFTFHLAVARASRNQFFITVMSFIEEQIVFSMNLSRNLSLVKTIERQRMVQAEHLAVLEAIRRHDAAGAADAMRRHLENARDRMFGS